MRTTIEISGRHRSILLSLAAQKGLRGYSRIVEEALDYYIEHRLKTAEKKMEILKMKGSWRAEEANKIRSKLTELRENWRPL